MNKEKVVRREYKIMLRADLFNGDGQKLLETASKFWHDFKQVIKDVVIDTNGDLDKIVKKRTVKFYDTNEHRLYSNNYVFRERRENTSGKREVTLKFRHPDRYISQDRNMDAKDTNRGKTKFEEDIKPPFLKLYSFSTKQKISHGKNLNKMKDPARLYPDLAEKLDYYEKNEEMSVVGNFTAREIVITGVEFQIGKHPKLKSAECALIVWDDDDVPKDKNPVAVEFSFRYEDKKENYTRDVAQQAYDVFQIMQKELKYWIEPNSKTKTAYVYSLAKIKSPATETGGET